MARIFAMSVSALLIVFFSSLVTHADQPVRIAGFGWSEFDFDTTVPVDALSTGTAEWPFADSFCQADPMQSSNDSTGQDTKIVPRIRPTAHLMSRSSYTCPFGSCYGAAPIESSNRIASTNPTIEKSEVVAKESAPENGKASTWSTLSGLTPIQFQIIESLFKFATASSDQFEVNTNEINVSKIPSRLSTDTDEYWKYYSDCDRWGVVFQVPRQSAFGEKSLDIPADDEIVRGAGGLDENDVEGASETEIAGELVVATETEPAPASIRFSVIQHVGIWLALGGQGMEQLGTGMQRVFREIEYRLIELPRQAFEPNSPMPLMVSFSIRKAIFELNRIRDFDGGLLEWIRIQRRDRLSQLIDSPMIPILIRARRDMAIAAIEYKLEQERKQQALGKYVVPRLKWSGDRLLQMAGWIEQAVSDQTAKNRNPESTMK